MHKKISFLVLFMVPFLVQAMERKEATQSTQQQRPRVNLNEAQINHQIEQYRIKAFHSASNIIKGQNKEPLSKVYVIDQGMLMKERENIVVASREFINRFNAIINSEKTFLSSANKQAIEECGSIVKVIHAGIEEATFERVKNLFLGYTLLPLINRAHGSGLQLIRGWAEANLIEKEVLGTLYEQYGYLSLMEKESEGLRHYMSQPSSLARADAVRE